MPIMNKLNIGTGKGISVVCKKCNKDSGKMIHANIASGTDKEASLFAIGPIDLKRGYVMTLGKSSDAHINGGGNMLFLGRSTTNPYTVTIPTEVTLVTETLQSGYSGDNAIYNILAPDELMRFRRNTEISSGIQDRDLFGRAIVQYSASGYNIKSPPEEFFLALTMKNIDEFSEPFVPLRIFQFNPIVGYIKNNTIIRKNTTQIVSKDGKLRKLGYDSSGYLIPYQSSSNGTPISFMKPN